ncbi:MAG: peptidase [Caulobacter sp.]|nr:peptidase [Caulobacter sp.]
MALDRTPALLVKSTGDLSSGRLGFGAASVKVKAEPLFEHIPADNDGQALGMAGGAASWQRLTLEDGADQNVWDLCHQLTRSDLGMAGGPAAVFAEPDLWQRWNHPMVEGGLGAAPTCGLAEPQRTNFPRFPGDNLWFRDVTHSGFGAMPGGADGTGSRIAHFDTGIDPHHTTLPAHLRLDLARNFVDQSRPNDPTDRSEGLLVQDGHGTGTLGILASQAYGGAPGAEVVPIRIADRVVLFRNSTLAKAFDYVYGLRQDPAKAIDVITMSMGGVASQAWADAINRLYEAGVFMVTAAGNNQDNFPTRGIVFPARFQRVTAACGVMFDNSPYADLGAGRMAGNYGPAGKMRTALAAFTPNVPWAVRGCDGLVNFSGQGTSCATPQIAAAAAVWIAHNRAALKAYSQPWMRVEAVRRALGQAARTQGLNLGKLGAGALRADAALGIAPPAEATLVREPKDSADFPILRILTGQAIARGAPNAMLELEALQLSQSAEVEALLPDPDVPEGALSDDQRRRISQALASQPGASKELKKFLGLSSSPTPSAAEKPKGEAAEAMARMHLEHAISPPVHAPASRRLRVYAFDPSLSAAQDTAAINIARLDVRWEENLKPGPIGEYLEVVDVDPASGRAYAPVDLNHPHLLSQDGLAPHPGDPRFHQQMAYAVAMTTIGHFERALGRSALWSSRPPGTGRSESFIRRLRIYPHAFRGQNAYYSAERKALLFGYFPTEGEWRDQLSGQLVFTCLSHDIVAHETTHALLDGIHPRYREATNPDVLALHEAFADLVALFQHFTMPEAVAHQIAATRGDLAGANPLVLLAAEFGRATSRGGEFQNALRAAVDDETKADVRTLKGDAAVLPIEVHERGARLMASVFDAFLKIYQQRADEVILLATGGSGVLPAGRLAQPLVQALAKEASKTAAHFMGICIRALDYCPPVDVEFSDYLRAMITADRDLVPDDPRGYRLALIAGFSKRGIFPSGVGALSPGSLVWEAPPIPITSAAKVLKAMNLGWDRRSDREAAWELSRQNARKLHGWLTGEEWVDGRKQPAAVIASEAELSALGLYRKKGRYEITYQREVTDDVGEIRREAATESVEVSSIEVHSVRPARRVSPDGTVGADLVVEITQSWVGPDGEKRRGGCTVLFDLESCEARYLIRKRVANLARIESDRRNRQAAAPGQTLWDSYFGGGDTDEPFAALHRH